MSRPDEAVEGIMAMIARNGWPAGYKLPSQRTLAEDLGFSRPTIREALVALETMGHVEVRPGKGVFLPNGEVVPSLRESRPERLSLAGRGSQMYQFRFAIEPAIAGLVAVNATAAQMEDMAAVISAMRSALERDDKAEFAQLDFTFHSLMVEAANNRFFTEAILPFLGQFHESQKLPFSMDDGIEDTLREHEEIMECLRKRSSHEAREAMARHIQGVASRAGLGGLPLY